MSEALTLNPVMEVENNTRIFDALRNRTALIAAGSALSVVALAGCTGNGNDNEARSSASPSAEATPPVAVSELCGDKVDTAANQQNFGSPESVLPKLFVLDTKGGKNTEVLLPVERAEEVAINQVANNVESLAILYTFAVETRETLQLPDAGTILRAKQNLDTFRKDPKQLADALNKTCAALSMLEQKKDFAVTRGQAMLVKANRTAAKNTYNTETVNATENLQGYKISYNKDDSDLTDVQRAVYDKLAELILITKDGKLVVNMTFGPNSFEIDNNKVQTPVSIKVEGDKQILVKLTEKDGEVEAGSKTTTTTNNNGTSSTGSNGGTTKTGTNGGSNPTGSNGGADTGNTGCGTAGNPECGGGTGSDTGNDGPTGEGTGPGPGEGPSGPSGPGEQPPAENPPAEKPPAENPPAENPPAENPPAENPPAEETPPPAEEETPPPAKPDPTENCNEYDPC